MDKELFDELLTSIQEAGRIARGEIAPSRVYEMKEPDVRHIRQGMGVSQSMFAALIGVSVHTLQSWEQGRRNPAGPAKVLLRLVQSDPEFVLKKLCNHT